MYELPQELSNDLKKEEILVKSRNWVRTQSRIQSPLQKQKFGNSAKKLNKISN